MPARKPILPPVFFWGAVAIAAALGFFLPGARFLGWPWRWTGILPIVFGVAWNGIADGAFRKAGTTVKPFEESSALLTGGVFAASRHPMYLGMTAILLGEAILFGALTPLLPAVLFPILMEIRFIRAEESMMEERFGEEWRAYRRRVRRWI